MLKAVGVPVPGKTEQGRISDATRSINERISTEEASLRKLKLQKRGLTHDLLTGRVPV
jgi:type I restriction enzyme S subunit